MRDPTLVPLEPLSRGRDPRVRPKAGDIVTVPKFSGAPALFHVKRRVGPSPQRVVAEACRKDGSPLLCPTRSFTLAGWRRIAGTGEVVTVAP